jgi:hypothetical protein
MTEQTPVCSRVADLDPNPDPYLPDPYVIGPLAGLLKVNDENRRIRIRIRIRIEIRIRIGIRIRIH